MSILRKWLGTERIYSEIEVGSIIPPGVTGTEQELDAARSRVNQSYQRIESKNRVFDSYAGKMRLMRGESG